MESEECSSADSGSNPVSFLYTFQTIYGKVVIYFSSIDLSINVKLSFNINQFNELIE